MQQELQLARPQQRTSRYFLVQIGAPWCGCESVHMSPATICCALSVSGLFMTARSVMWNSLRMLTVSSCRSAPSATPALRQ